MPSDVRLLDKGISETKKDEGGSFAALHSDKKAWQRRHRMLQLGGDGLGCYSLAEMASNATAWQIWPQMRQLGIKGLKCDSLADMASNATAWQIWPQI